LTVADIRVGLIGDSDSPVTGNDASTAVATIGPRIHFNLFSSRSAAKLRFAQATAAGLSFIRRTTAVARMNITSDCPLGPTVASRTQTKGISPCLPHRLSEL